MSSTSESWMVAPGGGLWKRRRTNRPEALDGAVASITVETFVVVRQVRQRTPAFLVVRDLDLQPVGRGAGEGQPDP